MSGLLLIFGGKPNHMRKLLFLLLLALPYYGTAQDIDLAQAYGLSYVHQGRTLTEKYGSISTAYANVKNYIDWARMALPYKPAMTDAEIMSTLEFPASWNDAVLKTDAPLGSTFVDYTNGIGSRASITVGHGTWRTNAPCIVAYGTYAGKGTGTASGSWGTTGGTAVVLDHARWLSRPFPERNAFATETYLRGTGWAESFNFTGFRLEGGRNGQVTDASFISYGFACGDAGETSNIEHVYALGFNNSGFVFTKGTPGNGRNLSSFSNGGFGFSFLDGGCNTSTFIGLSGDDNGKGLISVDGNTGIGGGVLNLIGIKYERGTRSPAVSSAENIVYIKGAAVVNIIGIKAQVHSGTMAHAIKFDARQPSGNVYGAQISVEGFRSCCGGSGAGFQHLFADHTSQWAMPPDCTPVSFSWTENGNFTANRTLAKTPVATVSPPPSPCTYTYSAWGACVNGQQTRTVTSSTPTGCVGTPGPLTQTCTVAPPPPPTTTVTTGVIVNTNDPQSAAIGAKYVERFGGQIVTVALGTSNATTVSVATAARNAINAALPASVTKLAICMRYPTRVEVSGNGTSSSHKHASINYALTHQFDASTNMSANWSSTARTALWVKDIAAVEAGFASHKAGEPGTVYSWSTFDANPSNPRGAAIATYAVLRNNNPPYRYEWFDNRPNWPAAGTSAPNFGTLYNQVFTRNKTDMIGYFIGLGGPVYFVETNTIRRGAIGSNITSYGGRIGQTYTQQEMTMFIDRGFVLWDGMVAEPGSADTRRFLDPRLALPLLYGGKTLAEVYRGAVVQPVRNLGAGCPDAAPYAR